MKRPSYISRLDAAKSARIHRVNKRVVGELSKSGLSKRIIDRRIQTNLKDVYQRLSMACAYEQTRIQYLLPPVIQKALDEAENLYFVTFGRPQDRVPVGSLKFFDPENLNRHFRRAIAKLKRHGRGEPQGLCRRGSPVGQASGWTPIFGNLTSTLSCLRGYG
jgi:hypothetical protein